MPHYPVQSTKLEQQEGKVIETLRGWFPFRKTTNPKEVPVHYFTDKTAPRRTPRLSESSTVDPVLIFAISRQALAREIYLRGSLAESLASFPEALRKLPRKIQRQQPITALFNIASTPNRALSPAGILAGGSYQDHLLHIREEDPQGILLLVLNKRLTLSDFAPTLEMKRLLNIIVIRQEQRTSRIDFIARRPVISYSANESGANWPVLSIGRTAKKLSLYLSHPKQEIANPDWFNDLLRGTNDPDTLLRTTSLVPRNGASCLVMSLTSRGLSPTRRRSVTQVYGQWPGADTRPFDVDQRQLPSPRLLCGELESRGFQTTIHDRNYVHARKGDTVFGYYISSSHTSPYTSVRAAGDKNLAKLLMRRAGVQVTEGRFFNDIGHLDDGLDTLSELGSVVVKPVDGTQARGVTIGVTGRDEFIDAWSRAFNAARAGILVEKYFEGIEARIIVVDGECVAAAQRKPPEVVGDGRSSIQDLILRINGERDQNPHLVGRPIVMTPTRVDKLARSDYNLFSVLPAGERLALDTETSLFHGGANVDITDQLHSSYKDAAARAVKAIPGLLVAGVDMLVKDPASPATGHNYAVLEVNTQPALGIHHFPFSGVPRNIASAIIDVDEGFAREPRTGRKVELQDVNVSVTSRRDVTTAILSKAFERADYGLTWLASDFFQAQRGSLGTNVWGSSTMLTGKSAVIATRRPKVAYGLLDASRLPLPPSRRVFHPRGPRDARSTWRDGLDYARSLESPLIRSGLSLPVAVDTDDEALFERLWTRFDSRSRHGLVVFGDPGGSMYRLLVAYGQLLMSLRADGTQATLDRSYERIARAAVDTFTGLDIGEVVVSLTEPHLPARTGNHWIIAVRARPPLAEYSNAEQGAARTLADEIVRLHGVALGNY